MDSNQSEQQYYLSSLPSNIISPAQYPCNVIGSSKNNIHTIVPNINNNNSLNVKYQNSTESKLAQSINYNCYSNNANSSYNQSEDLKFLFSSTKPKKVPQTKRVKGALTQCIDNSNNDITAAPNQLTILVQKVLPAQVPDHHPLSAAAAHISAAQSLPNVISPPREPPVVLSPVDITVSAAPSSNIDTIGAVINDVITKAISSDPYDDVFLSVLKSRCDPSSSSSSPPIEYHHQSTIITPHFTNIDSSIDLNNKRRNNNNNNNVQKTSATINKRPRLTEPIFNDTKSPYQRCQLSAPNFRKLVHEPRISDKSIVLPPLGVTNQQQQLHHQHQQSQSRHHRHCVINLGQLENNCVKYKRAPFVLSQPHPRPNNNNQYHHHNHKLRQEDRFIVENLNANIPSSELLSSHDIIDDIDCIVAPSPNNSDLDYLNIFNSDKAASLSPSINLEMLHPPLRTQSPQLSLFHCPNKDYLRLDQPPPPQSIHPASSASLLLTSITHKCASTPTSTDPLSDTSIVDSETGEMVSTTMKPHQKLQIIRSFNSNHPIKDEMEVVDDDTVHNKNQDFFEFPLYSEKVYKSTSLQWKRKSRDNNLSEDDDLASQSKDQPPNDETSSVTQDQTSISSKFKDQRIFIGEESSQASVVQVQGSISSKSKMISKRLHIVLNDKLVKKKPIVPLKHSPRQYKNIKYHRHLHCQTLSQSQTVVNNNQVISESQFLLLSRQSQTVLRHSFADSRLCCFCHQRGDSKDQDSGRLLCLDIDEWCHVNCALWCTGVIETQSGALINVPRSLTDMCSLCNEPGAGVNCHYPRCQAKYHVPCATAAAAAAATGGGVLVTEQEEERTVWCGVHRNELTTVLPGVSKADRRLYISRDECRQIVAALNSDSDGQMCVRIGALTVLSVGQLSPEQLHNSRSHHFHNLNHLYPIGFTSRRIHWSSKHVNRRSIYTCQIVLDDDRPLFVVTDGEEVYRARDCTSAWRPILDRIAALRCLDASEDTVVKYFPEHIKGEDLFGLTEPTVLRILESLPGLDTLHDYAFKYGKMELLPDMPLPLNEAGSVRCEPFQRHHHRHSHLQQRTRRTSFTHLLSPIKSSSSSSSTATTTVTMTTTKWQQYRRLKQEWRSNVVLKRSPIQGLGLFSSRDIDKGSMVIEYVGELIRNEVANRREQEYESRKEGCYMFRLDDATVIDASRAGNMARYINHSCEPNCVTEVLELDSRDSRKHIVVVSKRRIEKNEELNYDYKFDLEDAVKEEEKIPCLCGARSCRRWMN